MRDKPNEWVSIADLMAGVVAVVMLLFVVAVMQIRAGSGSLAACKELVHTSEEKSRSRREQVAQLLIEIESSIRKQGMASLIEIDAANQKITFKEGAFESGSACIAPANRKMFQDVGQQTAKLLKAIDAVEIYVDGHADANPAGESTDKRKCAYYFDNYTLSAARANEVRKQLINGNESSKNRIIVTGYGESRLLVRDNPGDARNRRVELRFVVPQDALGKARPDLLKRCLEK